MKLKRTKHSLPELNTASLPDLIFTVLFFFMVITHMRENNVQVTYSTPTGKELTKVETKSVIRVYIGKPYGKQGDYRVQVDNNVVPVEQVANTVRMQKEQLSADRQQKLTISFKADKDAPMWLVTKVKLALREAGALKINYSGYESSDENPSNEQ